MGWKTHHRKLQALNDPFDENSSDIDGTKNLKWKMQEEEKNGIFVNVSGN